MARSTATDDLKDSHDVDLTDPKAQRQVQELGYYHGYRAYQFYKHPDEPFVGVTFEAIVAVYQFDSALKKAFYPAIMKWETMLKNMVVAYLEAQAHDTSHLKGVFTEFLTAYQEVDPRHAKQLKKERANLRAELKKQVLRGQAKNLVVKQLIKREATIPLWVYFEMGMLGHFGQFVSLLGTTHKRALAQKIRTADPKFDPDGKFLEQHIGMIKSLRNNLAHNEVIFDTRFARATMPRAMGRQLANEFNLTTPVRGTSIIDYVVLLVHYFKALNLSKREVKGFVREVKRAVERLERKLNNRAMFLKIVGDDYQIKFEELLKY